LPGGAPPWLTPAMTVRTHLIQAKDVPAGTPVSYGHRYVTTAPTTLGLIPLGYNEGIPRSGRNTAQVFIRGTRLTISGTVCMNQCVVDAHGVPIEAGDEVILFGPGDHGEPTAQEWADLLDTLSYDIVTRFTNKIPRSYSGVTEAETVAVQTALAGSLAEQPAESLAGSAGLSRTDFAHADVAGADVPGGLEV
jgi:alanine racemase